MVSAKKGLEIGMDADLEELIDKVSLGRRTGEIKREACSLRTLAMLGRLYDENNLQGFVPRKIHTVGELYSFSKDEILHNFQGYGKKTWLMLNKILTGYGLPALKLPEEYTFDH